MENRKDSLSALKLCRFCLTQEGALSSLYDRTKVSKNAVTLPLKILSSVSIEVFPSDKMPCFICSRCKFFMELCYEYKQICRQADETILQYVQKGTSLETVIWPPSLVKLFHYGAKNSTDIGIVKTILEGGATVQVTSQEISDDDEDEDDENVYNIKIGDGTEEDSKATCIKVVTSKEKIGKSQNTKQSGKGFSTVSKLTRHVRTHAGERSYPCKHCNKCFTKSHHYTRHLRQKHQETMRTSHGPFGQFYQYPCEQCDDSFATQDELIYHSAIHATQNLTCPLCQEKFENVDAVTVHIKTHVNGTEFMCDLCELVFTSKEKLDNHLSIAHEEELQAEHTLIDESSMEMEAEDEDDDTSINVKEEYDHMLVEIKKPDDFMVTNSQGEDKNMNTNSEESEVEMTEDNMLLEKESKSPVVKSPVKAIPAATFTKLAAVKTAEKSNESQTASILRKAEEIKRKVNQTQTLNTQANKNAKSTKADSSNTGGASDKSLRLLEKELQDLKRTNSRNEAVKTPMKTELLKTRRPQIHTSTPKPRIKENIEEKKLQQSSKLPATEKKPIDRRAVTKENKEPKDVKDATNNVKEEKEIKEKDIPKNVKNGTNASDKSGTEETVRRSTRPSKIKDYAKMIRDRSQDDNDDDDSDDTNDEEYKEVEKTPEPRKPRRASTKPIPKPIPVAIPTATPRKRGRPRKNEIKELPSKIKKESHDENAEEQSKTKLDESIRTQETSAEAKSADDNKNTDVDANDLDGNTAMNADQKLPAGVLVSPTGQTLKKVPIRALPPGVKPLPLPVNARPMGPGEFCEMQIGKKVVKVQKIVMTKAEVEAMAKKGLVEMKDGTMVLKQGIKIPTADSVTLKSTLVGEETIGKESPIKKDKPAPMRCDLGEQA